MLITSHWTDDAKAVLCKMSEASSQETEHAYLVDERQLHAQQTSIADV